MLLGGVLFSGSFLLGLTDFPGVAILSCDQGF